MIQNISETIEKIRPLAKELQTYELYKSYILNSVKKIESDYQKGKISFEKYQSNLKHHLKSKSVEEVEESYDSYIKYLKEQIRALNKKVFYEAYNDHSEIKLAPIKIRKKAIKEAKKVPEASAGKAEKKVAKKAEPAEPKIAPKPLIKEAEEPIKKKIIPSKETIVKPKKRFEIFLGKRKPIKTEPAEIEPKPEEIMAETAKEKHYVSKKEEEIEEPGIIEAEQASDIPVIGEGLKEGEVRKVEKKGKLDFLVPKKLMERIKVPKKAKDLTEPEKEYLVGEIELPKAIKEKLKQRTFIGKKTHIPPDLVELETLRKGVKEEEAKAHMTVKELVEEAKKLKREAQKREKEKEYKPTAYGSVANLFVRKIGNWLVRKYPGVFEQLYSALRTANIKTLSNTYVNMIVLTAIIAMGLSAGFFIIFLMFTTYTVLEWLGKTLLMIALAGLIAVVAMFVYPFNKTTTRNKNIGRNLPFAINQMGAIAGSGLPPETMLKLVAETEEYQEINVELKKIVDYIELFGYDITTAVTTVSANIPNPEFKELLEGMIATLESGGDLKTYFTQKTNEIMLNYKLEQEKRIKTITTYSDVYTGILIAGPLFFISVLSLVSILGGQIGGIGVQALMAIGTYAIVPLINIGFLLFLQMTQPEI